MYFTVSFIWSFASSTSFRRFNSISKIGRINITSPIPSNMSDTSGGGDSSDINDLRGLIHKLRNEFSLLNPEDSRWPCPFCFHKSKTVVQCHIHVSREHSSLYIAGRSHQHNPKISIVSYESINDEFIPTDATIHSYNDVQKQLFASAARIK